MTTGAKPLAAAALLAPLLAACAAAPPPAPPPSPRRPAVAAPAPPRAADPPPPAAAAPEPAPAPAPPPPVAIGAEDVAVAVAAGRSLVDVFVPASSFVSLGVFGPRHALLGFDVVGVTRVSDAEPLEGVLTPLRAHRPLDEDSLLPRIVSFRSPADATTLRILVDAAEPVELRRVATPLVGPEALPAKGKPYRPAQAPSIGFPLPVTRDEGYFLQAAARYQFARADVVAALAHAFKRTRARFRRDPIAIADISQWDGIRPATDLGAPRHISHQGGRDVDVALAASDGEPSTVRAHCTGVLVEEGVQGCGPGTVRGFDAPRMAYFLGILFETAPPVEKVFIDDVYLREVRLAAEKLHAQRLLKDAGWEGLLDDAIMRPSPWHTDHLHVRFAGPPGKPAF